MTPSEVAATLIFYLNGKGFVIQRYDSVTTNSIYLKLDYGVVYTVRISDHLGKKHLKFRYNAILDGRKGWTSIVDTYPRFFYGEDSLN